MFKVGWQRAGPAWAPRDSQFGRRRLDLAPDLSSRIQFVRRTIAPFLAAAALVLALLAVLTFDSPSEVRAAGEPPVWVNSLTYGSVGGGLCVG